MLSIDLAGEVADLDGSMPFVGAFDPRSVLLFTFSSPNPNLDDLFEEHFDAIMAGVHIRSSTPTDGDPGPVAGAPR